MDSFSKRYGHVKVEEIIQINGITSESRTMIWNALYHIVWGSERINCHQIAYNVWVDFLKKPADVQTFYRQGYRGVVDLFDVMKNSVSSLEWYKVYDYIEFLIFTLNENDNKDTAILLSGILNDTFKKEGIAYTLIDGMITPVVGESEVACIQEALDNNNNNEYVRKHFETALGLLSNKTQPNYRNSIKESISAIESLCKKITGNEKGTLGECLVEIEKRGYIHKAMKGAFSQLYGYTSDEGGIRHAFKGEAQEPTLEDARFMLVSCSAFSNYLLAKMAKP